MAVCKTAGTAIFVALDGRWKITDLIDMSVVEEGQAGNALTCCTITSCATHVVAAFGDIGGNLLVFDSLTGISKNTRLALQLHCALVILLLQGAVSSTEQKRAVLG